MPSSLDMSLDPFLNLCDIVVRVLEIIAHVVGLAASHEAVLGRLARLGVNGPTAVLDAGRDMVGPTISFGVLKIEIFCVRR